MTHARLRLCTLPLVALGMTACAELAPPEKLPTLSASQLLKKPGGFYTDDGPDRAPPVDLDRVAEPQPKAEPLDPVANQPYSAFGRDYVPLTRAGDYRRQGTASWYGRKFHGQRTSSGEFYDMFALTAAHPTLPIPSYARVTNLANNRSVVVRINDRGPYSSGRILDVSYAAAHRLGFVEDALANVEVESLVPSAGSVASEPRGGGTTAAPAARSSPPAGAISPVAPLPIAAEPAGIFLQLGAFSNPANAENFSARVTRELEWLQQPLSLFGAKGIYRLRLGPFRSRAEAGQVAERIREALEVKPVVIVR